jgi:hypothetical protein
MMDAKTLPQTVEDQPMELIPPTWGNPPEPAGMREIGTLLNLTWRIAASAAAVNPSTQCPSQKSGNLRFLGFSAEPFLTSDV